MQQSAQKQTWRIAQWGTWGWAETIVKLVALVLGFIAFANTSSVSTLTIGGSPRLAAMILLGLLTLLYLALIGMRIQQREIVSVGFAIVNFLGHAGLLVALLRVPTQTSWALAFAIIYAIGQLIKIQFLRSTGYTESGATTGAMVNLNFVLTAVYGLFVVFLIL